jgi:hypothetical protein
MLIGALAFFSFVPVAYAQRGRKLGDRCLGFSSPQASQTTPSSALADVLLAVNPAVSGPRSGLQSTRLPLSRSRLSSGERTAAPGMFFI